jgi:hypothetical protein
MSNLLAVTLSFVGFMPADVRVVARGTGWWPDVNPPAMFDYDPKSGVLWDVGSGWPVNISQLPTLAGSAPRFDGWCCTAIFIDPTDGADAIALLNFIRTVQNKYYRVKVRIYIVYSTKREPVPRHPKSEEHERSHGEQPEFR